MLRKWKLRNYLIKGIKAIGWIVISAVALILLISLAIQIPYVQNKLTQKAVAFLEKKIGTEVVLNHISLSFPKRLVLSGIYLEDQERDTLFAVDKLSVNTNLWGLFQNEIKLDDIRLDNLRAYVSRSSPDSVFNFQYIVNAFAGDTTASNDTTQSPWKFSVGSIELTRAHVGYNDSVDENFADIRLGKLELDMDEFDLNSSRFKVNNFNLENVKAKASQKKVKEDTLSPKSSETNTSQIDFDFNEITLHSIEADYSSASSGQVFHMNLGNLVLTAENIDFPKREISLDEISVDNTFLSLQLNSDPTAPNTDMENQIDTITTIHQKTWTVSLNKIDLSNNNIQFHDFNAPIKRPGVDYSHLWITRLNANGEDLNYQNNQIRGKINGLSFLDKSGFAVSSFKSTFELTDTSALVRGFVLHTPHSKINLHADAHFESISTLDTRYPGSLVKLDIHQSTISLKDILYFVPTLTDSLSVNIPLDEHLKIDVLASGLVRDLNIDHFTMETLDETSLKTSGKITGLPRKEALFDLNIDKFYTSQADIKSILGDSVLPKSITLPEWVEISGHFTGSVNTPNLTADVNSDIGNITLKAKMNLDRPDAKPSYSGQIDIKNFQLGKVLKQEQTMGVLQMTAFVKGAGLTMEDLNTMLDVNVSDFEYQKYTYHGFEVHGTLKSYFFSGIASLDDTNLNFKLEGDLDYNSDVPEYAFKFELKNADFKALNISERPLRARGTIDVNLNTADFRVINGNLDIRNVAIYNGQDLYAVDSLLFASVDQKGESKISIRSDILTGDFEGTINLFAMPDALRRHFNNYFSLNDPLYATKLTEPQNFDFKLVLKNTDLLTKIIFPELTQFVPARIEGAFNSNESRLDLNFDITKVIYAGMGLDSVSLHVSSDKRSMGYAFGLRKIRFDTLHVEAIQLKGNVANDSIRTKFVILDSLQKDKYALGGAFYSLEKAFQFHLLPDQITINYAPWESPPDNSLKFTSKGITTRNFSITNINERITLLTQQKKDSSTSIVFKDLNLQNLANLVEGTILADGLMNGDFNVAGEGAFNSNLKIRNFKVLNQSWGDVILQAGRTTTGPYNFDLEVTGDNTSLRAGGYYVSNSASPNVNVIAKLSKLDLHLIEPFTGGHLKNTEGSLTGDFTITGDPSKPQIAGTLAFQDAILTPSFSNSKFFLKNERISFTEEGIILPDFKILDEKNNTATLKGKIKTSDYSDFVLDLNLTAKNFQVINTTEDDNDLFYGKVGINTTAKISGNSVQPKIQMEISMNDDSQLTYIVPQSEKGVLEQKGIVVFVDRDAKKDPFLAGINTSDTVKSTFTGLDLTANIELDDEETLSIIIDPVTGDKLSVKGNSTLTLNIDPTGDIQLSGRYEITEGSYDLTFYKLVKRNFAIEKGSTIVWAGNPLEATMDIKASFTVETSPLELVSNQQTVTSAQMNTYKQRLPFIVYLKIKGDLLAPEISFELDMPIEKRNAFEGSVYAKIKDINTRESDLNKQVFALLILRRFISDNPFDSQSGGDVESTARRSVSKLLSEQLNRLSENVKGIELSFDVKSYDDYSTGEAQAQTEVQLGVSKSLLDDKLIVKVSGNVDIEGNTGNQNSFADYIGDLALEYKLTEDGRFRITGFRNSNYDIISGELIETGAGLIYIKDYNTLRELFKANAKSK